MLTVGEVVAYGEEVIENYHCKANLVLNIHSRERNVDMALDSKQDDTSVLHFCAKSVVRIQG